jgi:hypothetical protein
MRNRPIADSVAIDPSDLAAMLAEVNRAILAVGADTGEHRPLRDIVINPADEADTVVGR